MEITDSAAWDEYVTNSPFGHPLQLWGWGEVKSGNGWSAHRLALVGRDSWVGAVQILLWRIPKTGRVVAYVPRGPVVDPAGSGAGMLLNEVVVWAKARKAIYVRIEPAWTSAKLGPGWIPAKHHVQMRETYTIDLKKDVNDLMAAMGRKHRQYIRQAERNGVDVRLETVGDLDAVYDIYQQTAQRAGFALHAKAYYQKVFDKLHGNNALYVAYVEERPAAFLWLAMTSTTAYELYGGMNESAAKAHANYLLKWQAISDMKAAGQAIYDFNGRVSEGVSTFKAGFGPDETDYIGTYDFPISRVGYQIWEKLWPLAKPVGRRVLGLLRGGRG